jgi:hypothetical protein
VPQRPVPPRNLSRLVIYSALCTIRPISTVLPLLISI